MQAIEASLEGISLDPTAIPHGASRITWVSRNRAGLRLAIGQLYAYDEGRARAGTRHRLKPLRHLMPGRYDLRFARYGVAWPVTLSYEEGADDPRMMIVEGRVPL